MITSGSYSLQCGYSRDGLTDTHFWGPEFWDLVHLLDKWYSHISCIKMLLSSYFYKKA